MVTTREPLAIYQIAENLRQCVSDRLADTPSGEPARSCVVTGEIAWDDCECDGQLVVSINQSYFSSNFPTQGNTPPALPGNARCGPPILVVEYVISMLRCSPIGGDDPNPPDCDALSEAARITERDAHAVQWGAHCCLKAWSRPRADPEVKIHEFVLQSHPRTGPQGGCQGSALTVLVGIVNACPPCDEVEES